MFPCELCNAADDLRSLRRYDLAEQQYRALIARGSRCGGVHARLGACLADLGRYYEAYLAAAEGARLSPNNDLVHWTLSVIHWRREELQAAERSILEAIRLAPGKVVHVDQLARVCLAMERWQDAIDAAERGLAIDPALTSIAQTRALALARTGRTADAIAAMEAVLARDPESAWAHAALGEVYLRSHEPDKARVSLREALRLDPTIEFAQQNYHNLTTATHDPVCTPPFLWSPRLQKYAGSWLLVIACAVVLFLEQTCSELPGTG